VKGGENRANSWQRGSEQRREPRAHYLRCFKGVQHVVVRVKRTCTSDRGKTLYVKSQKRERKKQDERG